MRIWLLAVLFVAGCDYLPRDVEGTSERVLAAHAVRVGVAEPIGVAGTRFLDRLSRDRGQPVVRTRNALEPLLVDLVVAPFAQDSQWQERVALSPPLDGSEPSDRPLAVRAAIRNGENRWLMHIERIVRAGTAR